MPATRFPARAAGPAARMAGFLAHLRGNGMAAGPSATADALDALATIDASAPVAVRLALRALCVGRVQDWRRFDDLFDAYWLDGGRARVRPTPPPADTGLPRIWRDMSGGAPGAAGADDDAGEDTGEGRLIASRREALGRRDLRELASEAELRAAEHIAERLARAIHARHARRFRAARRGAALDLRRTLRRAPSRGGEPIDLMRRRRREPPLSIVALLDVSGSMSAYARVFLAFLRGLVGADPRARACVFHTRLLEVTGALTEPDALRAAAGLAPMSEGFGGGTRIGHCLGLFNAGHARGALGRRSAVLILSDGYDTDPPTRLAAELARLRRRARRIVWLNPLAGRRAYAPVAAGMAAALSHLDALLPAGTLDDLAALEGEFERL